MPTLAPSLRHCRRPIGVCRFCLSVNGLEGSWMDASHIGRVCLSDCGHRYRKRLAFICPGHCPLHQGDEFAFLTEEAVRQHTDDGGAGPYVGAVPCGRLAVH